MKVQNNNVATFIDLFLMAFIATMILNIVSPKNDFKERYMFKFTTPKVDNVALEHVGFLHVGGDVFSSEEGDNDIVTWDKSRGQLSGTFLANPGADLKLEILVFDDYGVLSNKDVRYNFTSSTVVENGTLKPELFYKFSSSLNK